MNRQLAEDAAQAGRRRAIYVLTAFCASFFIGGIVLSYVVASRYGYGTGIGDGFVAAVPKPKGSGFFGDIAIFTANTAIDAAILYFWYWLPSRLEAVGSLDDPLAPEDNADLTHDESWYYIQVPKLTASLMGIAMFCIVGVVVLVASILPVVLIRYGW